MVKDIIKILFFFLIKFVPKKNNLLVFGDRAGRRFADNSRYLYLHLNKNNKNFNCIWITKNKKIKQYLNDKGYYCYINSSLLGIYYSLRAKYHVYNFVENDINEILSEFSNSILLWHGVLPKKLKPIEINTSYISQYLNKKIKKYFLYPNKEMSLNIMNRFPKNKYELFLSNLPRNIGFENKENFNDYRTSNEIDFINKIRDEKKNIFGYFPTWRLNGLELFYDVKNFNDLLKTNKILEKSNSIILIKKHMNSEKEDNNILYNKDIENISNFLSKLNNFKFVDYEFDLNSILHVCDVLISDYSGVIFDYLYLDRPIIIYAPDYTKFNNENGFVFDPLKNKIGHVANNLNDLNNLIYDYSSNKIEFKEKYNLNRKLAKNKVFSNDKGIKNLINLLQN